MNKQNLFLEYREKYQEFIYEKFEIIDNVDTYKIIFYFEIKGLEQFTPYLEINKKYFSKMDNLSNELIFHIGMVELISYWKASCPKKVIIKAGYLDEEQINWFKKLYYNGLGEFFYTNGITTSIDDFLDITCVTSKPEKDAIAYQGNGNLIPIGGGKDSVVSLELLKNEDNACFIMNPKEVSLECAKVAGFNNSNTITIKRILDKRLIELNNKGYLNGHTPFSALLAFVTYFMAYQNNKRYITLSNEGSANEATVIGTNINHQYSKTYEFENDFNNYTLKYFNIEITYFSFLRPLSEFQIAMLFSKFEKYHDVFKSCNVGSKEIPWKWCCNCGKCLFVYIILSPFLYKEKLVSIFKEDLFDKKELINIFLELTGNSTTKPFDCVGTIEEVRFALSLIIRNLKEKNETLPYLLDYYEKNYELSDLSNNILSRYNEENNLNSHFEEILRNELKKYV